MQVLVIGGTHFLGKYAVRSLVTHGHQVTSMNIDPQAAEHLPQGVESIFCNRKDHQAVRAALSGRTFDAVVDIVHAPTVIADIAAVLDATGGERQRYVYCSSSTIYQKMASIP